MLGTELHALMAEELKAVNLAKKLISRIDELLGQDQSGRAAAEYRLEMNVSWDEAHDAIESWKSIPKESRTAEIAWTILEKQIKKNWDESPAAPGHAQSLDSSKLVGQIA